MLLANDTPFAAIGFGQLHRDGASMAVIAVRGRYDLAADGRLHIAEAQDVVLSDAYEGEGQRAALVRVGDLIPYKPAADLTVLGQAHAPGGRATRSWMVALTLGDHRAPLRVHGPRAWEPTLRRLKPTWKLGQATPVTTVALDYRLASGGRFVGDPDGAADPRNPIGPGILHADHSKVGRPLRAPQIDGPYAEVDDPFATPKPQGFGPIPPWWLWRSKYAGAYDDAWAKDPVPRLAADFDYRFYQTAHANLIVPYPRGDETIHLEGLAPGGGAFAFALPGVALVAHHDWFDGRRVSAKLALDGVHIDLRAEPWRVDLTWRGWIAACPAYNGAALALDTLAAAEGLPVSGEHGLIESEPGDAS